MIKLDLLPPPQGLARDLLKDKEASRKALKATVRDLGRRGPAQVSKAVRAVYSIKAGDIAPGKGGGRLAGGARVRGAGETVDTFTLVYTGSPMTPTHFRMSPGSASGGRRYTIKATIFKGARVKIGHWAPRGSEGGRYARPSDSPFFLVGGRGGSMLPMQRRGGKLHAMRTVSLPQMVGKEEVAQEAMGKLSELARGRLEHHLRRFMK
ncbi:hypothetical protein [Adlercreutzia caecimuris]|uniref:hypothetical protein n=1 Tax=Adlercreutzia caecimuris TaxID=671266 RepID=UPI001C3EEE56|nr:hypothetical protein [Adlercreutzia caecimuris]